MTLERARLRGLATCVLHSFPMFESGFDRQQISRLAVSGMLLDGSASPCKSATGCRTDAFSARTSVNASVNSRYSAEMSVPLLMVSSEAGHFPVPSSSEVIVPQMIFRFLFV